MTAALELDEKALDTLFLALANRTRREILDIVAASPGSTVGAVSDRFDMSRIGIHKHLAVLEESGLIVSERRGRERHLWLNAVPLQWIHERWSERYRAFWAGRLTRLKYESERGTSR
jgi:DNA-binding transcriptional ArsR family regulator